MARAIAETAFVTSPLPVRDWLREGRMVEASGRRRDGFCQGWWEDGECGGRARIAVVRGVVEGRWQEERAGVVW